MKQNSAFSLVEVTIALGIVSVAIVSVIGLIPHGLTVMRQAKDQTAEAQIVRRVIGEAAMTPFSQLEAFAADSPYYYTVEGKSQEQMDADTRFEVNVTIQTSVFPGSSSVPDIDSHLKTMVVETARVAGGVRLNTTRDVVSLPNTGI